MLDGRATFIAGRCGEAVKLNFGDAGYYRVRYDGAMSAALASTLQKSLAKAQKANPIEPRMIGVILGPAADQHLRRTLSISQGDWTVFATHPIAAALLLAALGIVASGLVSRHRIKT